MREKTFLRGARTINVQVDAKVNESFDQLMRNMGFVKKAWIEKLLHFEMACRKSQPAYGSNSDEQYQVFEQYYREKERANLSFWLSEESVGDLELFCFQYNIHRDWFVEFTLAEAVRLFEDYANDFDPKDKLSVIRHLNTVLAKKVKKKEKWSRFATALYPI